MSIQLTEQQKANIVHGLIILAILMSVIVAIFFVLHVSSNNKLFKAMQQEKEALHNEIINNHIQEANYADSLHDDVQKNIEANKAQAKAISDKVESNFKTTLKLLKQRNDEERNSVLGTTVDSTLSNVRKYYFPN